MKLIRKVWDYMRGYPRKVVELEEVVRNLESELGTKASNPMSQYFQNALRSSLFGPSEKNENRARRLENIENKVNMIVNYLKIEKKTVQEKTSYCKIKKGKGGN